MPYKAYQNVKNEDGSNGAEMEVKDSNGEDTGKTVAPWLSKIKSGAVKKLPKDVLKRRRNYKLKKIITPKAPSMVLNEVVGCTAVKYDAHDMITVGMGTRMMRIKAEFDGVTFEGIGPNKSVAKNNCAEKILMHVVLKMSKSKMDHSADVKAESMDFTEDDDKKGDNTKEDEMPWTALASLGLFKLFSEWQASGATLPADLTKSIGHATMMPPMGMSLGMPQMGMPPMGRGMSPMGPGMPPMMPGMMMGMGGGMDRMPMGMPNQMMQKAPKVKKEKTKTAVAGETKEKALPENPTSRHPVQLLNEMIGQIAYQNDSEGTLPDIIYIVTADVKGVQYVGRAPYAGDVKKSRKNAKKACAEAVLKSLYNVTYPPQV